MDNIICFFGCTNSSQGLINCGIERIKKIEESSLKRGDELANRLVGLESITCHENCVSTYTSSHHIKRFLSKQKGDTIRYDEGNPKKIPQIWHYTLLVQKHCFFCGEFCISRGSDTRNPSRWRKVVQCRTADGLKDNILETCDHRKDHQADEVRIRLSGAVSDLQAADAQYHLDYYKTFMSKKNMNAVTNSVNNSAIDQDPAFDALVKDMSTDKSCVWNSHEIQQAYRDHGGTIMHRVQRQRLLQRREDYFEGDLLVLSGNGVANILLFRSTAPGILKIADDSSYIDIVPMAKVIRQECSASAPDTDKYKIRLSLSPAAIYYLPCLQNSHLNWTT